MYNYHYLEEHTVLIIVVFEIYSYMFLCDITIFVLTCSPLKGDSRNSDTFTTVTIYLVLLCCIYGSQGYKVRQCIIFISTLASICKTSICVIQSYIYTTVGMFLLWNVSFINSQYIIHQLLLLMHQAKHWRCKGQLPVWSYYI